MILIINIFLTFLAMYFTIGLFFGIYFLVVGAKKIDPILAASKWKVRLLLFPGAIVTWPFLLLKIITSKTAP